MPTTTDTDPVGHLGRITNMDNATSTNIDAVSNFANARPSLQHTTRSAPSRRSH
jgi:hypothetical protein